MLLFFRRKWSPDPYSHETAVVLGPSVICVNFRVLCSQSCANLPILKKGKKTCLKYGSHKIVNCFQKELKLQKLLLALKVGYSWGKPDNSVSPDGVIVEFIHKGKVNITCLHSIIWEWQVSCSMVPPWGSCSSCCANVSWQPVDEIFSIPEGGDCSPSAVIGQW